MSFAMCGISDMLADEAWFLTAPSRCRTVLQEVLLMLRPRWCFRSRMLLHWFKQCSPYCLVTVTSACGTVLLACKPEAAPSTTTRVLSTVSAEDFKADIYSFGVVCWNVLSGGIRDSGGDWSAPCYTFSSHNFSNLANNHRLLEKHVPLQRSFRCMQRSLFSSQSVGCAKCYLDDS